MIRTPRAQAVVVFVLACCAACTFFLWRSALATNSGEAVAYWREEIKYKGGSAAYEEFSRSIATLGPPQQHVRAHEFGDALYDELGTSGVIICDEQFEQGCMHEVVGRAVVDKGLPVLDSLHNECNAALAPHSYYCQHSVGHALVTYFGPTGDGLNESLDYCIKHETEDPLHGCFTGAFMEFFERNVTMGEDSPRPVENGNYLSVCPEFSGTSEWLCYFTLPRWWRQLLIHAGVSELQAIPQLVPRCELAPDGEMRDACDAGIGEAVPRASGYDVALSIQTCETIAKNERFQAICRAQAANDFLLVGHPEKAQAVCVGLVGQSLAYCSAYAEQLVQRSITVLPPR